MCGFVGMVHWGGLKNIQGATAIIQKANQTLTHRGPDGEGLWSDAHCALGFRRLSIIDLSNAGQQPMANEDGNLHVVFNGEIYNYQTLSTELQAKGHHFKSKCDTEVLLHGYEEWGLEALLEKLRGMFSFALWDSKQRKLLLARDPLGVKPLYFAERGEMLIFASEPKAIFATGLVQPELDPVAIHQALTYRYVPAPRTGFKDVEKLPAGHLATAHEGLLRYRKWYAVPEKQTGVADENFDPEKLDTEIKKAIQRREVADVPIGAWLSGGIDSAIVVSGMQSGVQTFAAGFKQKEYDERGLALQSAKSIETAHHEFEVPADIFNRISEIVWHADEPYFNSSCLPTYVLAEQTRQHVKVAMSGDGGDESFAGYERYLGMKYLAKWKRIPGGFRKLGHFLVRLKSRPHSRQGLDRIIPWLEKCLVEEKQGYHPYLAATSLFDQSEIFALYGDLLQENMQEVDGREYLDNHLRSISKVFYPDDPPGTFHGDIGILQRADLATYLPEDVLMKTDRMSMAHGLEVRSPFLDIDLVKTALSIPEKVMLPRRTSKPLLRAYAANQNGKIPTSVIRARKKGFGVPVHDWFRGPLKKIASEIFNESNLVKEKILKPNYWLTCWDQHQNNQGQHGKNSTRCFVWKFGFKPF